VLSSDFPCLVAYLLVASPWSICQQLPDLPALQTLTLAALGRIADSSAASVTPELSELLNQLVCCFGLITEHLMRVSSADGDQRSMPTSPHKSALGHSVVTLP
jgi:hypothetical protein